MNDIEAQFDADMENTYLVAKRDLKYNASYLRQMIDQFGGLGAAKRLIAKDNISEGFIKLWELNRLDLTAEALVLKPEYASLFADDEKAKARKRLTDVGYKI